MSLREVDQSVIAGIVRQISGTCKFCGCHGDSCKTGPGDTCGWMNELKTLCSNPKCVAQDITARKVYSRTTRRVSLFGKPKDKKKGKR